MNFLFDKVGEKCSWEGEMAPFANSGIPNSLIKGTKIFIKIKSKSLFSSTHRESNRQKSRYQS